MTGGELQEERQPLEWSMDTVSVDLNDSNSLLDGLCDEHSQTKRMNDLNVSSCSTTCSTTCPEIDPLQQQGHHQDGVDQDDEGHISPRSVANPRNPHNPMPLPYKPTKHATQRGAIPPKGEEEMPFDCGPPAAGCSSCGGVPPRKQRITHSILSSKTSLESAASPLKSTSFRLRRMQLAQQRKWKEEHLGKLVQTKSKGTDASSERYSTSSNNPNNKDGSPDKSPSFTSLVGQEQILSPSSLSQEEDGNTEVSLGAHLGRYAYYSSTIPVTNTTMTTTSSEGNGRGGESTPEVSSRLEYSDSQDAIVYQVNDVPSPAPFREEEAEEEDEDSMTIDTVSSLNSSQSERTRTSTRSGRYRSRHYRPTLSSSSHQLPRGKSNGGAAPVVASSPKRRTSKSSKSRERRDRERELDYDGVHPPMYVSSVKKKVKRKSLGQRSNSGKSLESNRDNSERTVVAVDSNWYSNHQNHVNEPLSPQTEEEIESILKHGTRSTKRLMGSSNSSQLWKKKSGGGGGRISPNHADNLDVTHVISNHGRAVGGASSSRIGVDGAKGTVPPPSYTSTPSASTTTNSSSPGSASQETPFKELPFSPILSISPTETPYLPSPPITVKMVESPSEPPSLSIKDRHDGDQPTILPSSSPSMSEPPSLTQEGSSPTGSSSSPSQPPSLRKDRTKESERGTSPSQEPPSLSKTKSKTLPATISEETCPPSPTLETEMPGSNCPKTLQRRRMKMYLSKRGMLQLQYPEQNASKELDNSHKEVEDTISCSRQPREDNKEVDPNLTTDQTHMERQFNTDTDLLPDQILVPVQETIPEEMDAKSTTSYRTCRTCLSTKPSNQHDFERALKLKKRQIHLFHHTLTCSHPPPLVPQYDGNRHVRSFSVQENYKVCPQVRNCYALSILVKHVQTCTVSDCPVPKCRAYKKVWNHYRRCIGRTFTIDDKKRKKCRLCCDLWEKSRRDFDDSDDELQ